MVLLFGIVLLLDNGSSIYLILLFGEFDDKDDEDDDKLIF